MLNLLLAPSFDRAFEFSYIFKTLITKWYYYLILAVVLVLVVLVFFIKKQPKRNNLNGTRKLVYISIFASISAVANIFDIPVSSALQISLVATVGLISGYVFGAGPAFVICFVGDLIGAIIAPKGPYNPIIAIGTGLLGLIPGVAFSYFRGKDLIKIIVVFFLTSIICSFLINTIGYALMYPKYTTMALSLGALPVKILVMVLNAILSYLLIDVLKKVLPKQDFNFAENKQKESEVSKSEDNFKPR